MNYKNPIYTEKTQCQDCYKCIRECPVKAIRVEHTHAMVIPELCVLCGHCVTSCPANAKHVRDDLSRAKQLLTLKKKVILSLAPSFVSDFSYIDQETLISSIKKLGFWAVSETAIGADLVSAQMAEILNENSSNKPNLFLSSACPSVVEYIKLYMSDYSPYLTEIASPLLAHARFLKSLYGNDIGIIFAGPCIAKKRESDVFSEIDCAINFQDLKKWLLEIDSEFSKTNTMNQSNTFMPFKAAKGSLYPVDGGMIASIKKYSSLDNVHMMSVSGLDEIYKALHGLEIKDLKNSLFMELLACPGGCINGPSNSLHNSSALRRINLLEYGKRANEKSEYTRPNMIAKLTVEERSTINYSNEDIKNALRQIGKTETKDEVNCGSCGYNTCISFAKAFLEKRAEKTMCVSYMRTLAQKKANGLIRAIPAGVVICDSSLRIIECNKYFSCLMGNDIEIMFNAKPGLEGADFAKISSMSKYFLEVISLTGPDALEHDFRDGHKIFHISVFSIEKGESACGVIQDVTLPQIQKDRVISQTRRVINKNLALVQKIAYLLGENAAETEATLNSIIESFSSSEKGDE